MYVRYATHLGAYLGLTANPYPGFTGSPGYPVDVQIPPPQTQSRGTIAIRILLAVPALLLAAALGSGLSGGGGSAASREEGGTFVTSTGVGGVAAVCAFLGWFASLARGRMPNGLRDLGAYGLGYTAQAYAYALLLTDRYPNSDPDELGPAWSLPPHPVGLELQDDGRRSRLTVLFRLLLALPHFVWLALWTIAAILAAIANWFVALVRGRSAGPLHRFLSAYIRYTIHLTAFVFLDRQPVSRLRGGARLSRRHRNCAARAAEPVGHVLPDVPCAAGVPHLERAGRRPLHRGIPRLVCRTRHGTDADRLAEPRRDGDPLPGPDGCVLVRPERPLSVFEPGPAAAARA